MKLKEELLKKIQEDECERNYLENQLAKVERDEMKIIKNFRNENDEQHMSRSFDKAHKSLQKQILPHDSMNNSRD